VNEGLEIHYDGDLPARSGLGSSSAFSVGLIHALYGIRGRLVDKELLAKDAINIEQNIIGESVGSQDQIAAAYGGLNKIDFHRDDTFSVSPLVISTNRKLELQNHLMLCFTGFSRIANEVAQSKIKNFQQREKEIFAMSEMVNEAMEILTSTSTSINDFGNLLNETWKYKRGLSEKVTTPEIDKIYEIAMKAGALGGKLLGAGGGGFMLFFAKPEDQQVIRDKLSNLVHVNFKFDNSGSRVALYQPEGF
jgi:D-glycero-alpha-D-manno-heptose-7-phosphate kinase